MSDTQQGQDNNRQHERDGDEQQVKRARYEYDYNNLIVVLVGKFEVQFQVHKDTICDRSKFFQAAVSSDRWVEGQEKLVRLPEVSMDEFRMYVHWAYTGKISPEVYSQQSEIEQEMEQDAYYYAYILADILDDGELRTHVLDTIIAKSVDWPAVPGPEKCRPIWRRTPQGCPLRTFILEWKASAERDSSFAESVEHFPKEFLAEMAVILMNCRARKAESPEAFAARIREQLFPKSS